MVQYIYFVKCPNCEDEHFDFFDEAKEFALSCLGSKPVITQTEVCRNDFGECTDSSDLGTIWSWEDEAAVEDDAAIKVFTTGDFAEYNPDNDPEFDTIDNSVDFNVDDIPDNFHMPVTEDFDQTAAKAWCMRTFYDFYEAIAAKAPQSKINKFGREAYKKVVDKYGLTGDDAEELLWGGYALWRHYRWDGNSVTEEATNKFVIVGEFEDYTKQFYNADSVTWVARAEDATLYDDRNDAIVTLSDLDTSEFYTTSVMIRPTATAEACNKKLVEGSFVSKYDYSQMTKDELYSHLVDQGNVVEIAVGDQGSYNTSFADAGVYSDSVLEVEFENGVFNVIMWNYSDDGDMSEDTEYKFSTESFDELWEEVMDFSPEALREASCIRGCKKPITEDNKVLKATRTPKDSDYIIVSKHADGSYSFLGNNYRMTKQLDNAMTYAGKADAEYDIKYAEDQAEASSANYDSYISNPFFVTTFSEARKLVDDRAAYVKQRDEKIAARSALGVEVRELARKMYKQGTACNTFEEFEAYMLENGYDKPTKYLYYSTYRNELMRCAKSQRKPIPEGMTIEQLVEEMEENENTVECTWCNELFDKSECRKEVDLGWLCSRCEAAIKSRGEALTFKENNYWDFLDEDYNEESQDDYVEIDMTGMPLEVDLSKTPEGEGSLEEVTINYCYKIPFSKLLKFFAIEAPELLEDPKLDVTSDTFDYEYLTDLIASYPNKGAYYDKACKYFYDDALEQLDIDYANKDSSVLAAIEEYFDNLEPNG